MNYPLILSDFSETRIFSTIYIKILKNTEFNENPFTESLTVPCGWTDMTKLIAAFRNILRTPLQTYLDLRVKCPIYCLISTEFAFSQQILMKVSNTKISLKSDLREPRETDRHDEANRRYK